jgi:hypothetical protein
MEKIGQSVDLFLLKAGLKEQLMNRDYLALWSKVAGEYIVHYTRPLAIKEKKLLIEVTDSTWLYHLTLLKSRIITDFNTAAGCKVINDIKFFNADFHTRVSLQEKNLVFKKEEEFSSEEENITMDHGEEENLKKAVLLSPEPFHPRLSKFLKKSCLYLKQHQKKGARTCHSCRDLFNAQNSREELCPHCTRMVKSWLKVLKIFFKRTPWLKYNDILQQYPSLDDKVFCICKNEIINKYKRRLLKILENKRADDKIKKRVLYRLVQRYVLLVEAKEPVFIEQADMIRALQDIPDLYLYLDNSR